MTLYAIAPIPEMQAAICRVASRLHKRHVEAHNGNPAALYQASYKHFEQLKVTWRQHKVMMQFLSDLQIAYSIKIKGDLDNA